MTVLDLLQEFREKGIEIEMADDDKLRFKARSGALTPELKARLKHHKGEILAFLAQAARVRNKGMAILESAPKNLPLPLSQAQERLWFVEQLNPGSRLFHIPRAVRLRGPLHIRALEQSIRTIIQRQESLRTAFIAEEGQPRLQIFENLSWQLVVEDLSGLSPQNREKSCAVSCSNVANSPFDLTRAPLFRARLIRLGAKDFVFIFNMHHLISDAWSMGLFIGELSGNYNALCLGQSLAPVDLPVTYSDFAWSQRRVEEGLTGLDYWKHKLAGLTTLDLPLDRRRPVRQTHVGERLPFTLDPRLVADLRNLASQQGTSLYMVLLTAFLTLLQRYSGQSDICLGTSIGNRKNQELEKIIGLFVNMLVIRCDFSGDPRWCDLLQQVKQTTLEAFEYHQTPFEKVVDAMQPGRDPSRHPLFQVEFIFTSSSGKGLDLHGLQVEPLERQGSVVARVDLSIAFNDQESGPGGGLVYNPDLFLPQTMITLVDRFQILLQAIVQDPTRELSALPLLTAGDLQRISSFSSQPQHVGSEASLSALFAEQVAARPDAIAVNMDQESLTYSQLNRLAWDLAFSLVASGVAPEDRVGIYLERSPRLLVGMLATLMAGGVYVPLDPNNPAERIRTLLEDAGITYLISETEVFRQLEPHLESALAVRFLDEIAGQPDKTAWPDSLPVIHADQAAYIIYTSGSTGKPKGVMVSNRQVVRLFHATGPWFHFGAEDVWTLFHSFAFDFSVWEIWGALLYGGRLVIVPYWVSRSPDAFHDLLCREKVTVLNQTPSAFSQLVTCDELTRDRGLNLRYVIFGGEALNLEMLAPWVAKHGDRAPQLINMYGITETTVHVTYRPISAADIANANGSPIGTAIPDLSLHLLDQRLNPTPPGITGEIFVGGAGLARGYFNHPAFTARRYIANPFDGEPGSRLYRTGDLGRYNAEGALIYMGRIDHQVKIRGFRIELGEISSALSKIEAVKEAVILVEEKTPGKPRLVAFYTSPNGPLDQDHLRHLMEQRLPTYMIPTAFVYLPVMPMTTSGKLDRRLLLESIPEIEIGDEAQAAPRNDRERAMATIWADVLGLERVGIHANFFALGGDSLLSIQIKARARQEGLDFDLPMLFTYPTVAALTRALGTSEEPYVPVEPFSMIPDQVRAQLPEAVIDAYPLSSLQLGMLFHSAFEDGSTFYHDVIFYHLRLPWCPDSMTRVLQSLSQRHEIFRTGFEIGRFDLPLQLVYKQASIPLEVIDLRADPEFETTFNLWVQQQTKCPFQWDRAPLLRCFVHRASESEFWLSFNIHHAIIDGWSDALLFPEVLSGYRALLAGQALPDQPPPAAFREYIALERQALANPATIRFWDEQMSGFSPTLVPRWPGKPQKNEVRHQFHLMLPISDEDTRKLNALAKLLEVNLKVVMLALHFKALGIVTGCGDVVTGVLSNGRPEVEGGARAIGVFLNTLPYRMKLRPGSWCDLIRETFALDAGIVAHRRFPMHEIMKRQDTRQLFEAQFNFTHFHAFESLKGTGAEEIFLKRGIASDTNFTFVANFGVMPVTKQLYGRLTCEEREIGPEQARSILACYSQVLQAMIEDPHGSHLLSFLEPGEKQLLAAWNDSGRPDGQVCMHHLFLEQALRTPDHPALIESDRTCSYQEVREKVAALASHLLRRGMCREQIVGVYRSRSSMTIIAMLAVLEAGGTYLPLDPAYPQSRLNHILEDASVSMIITHREMLAALPQTVADLVLMDDLEQLPPSPDLRVPVHPASLAYVIYTSGSTGKPKGVCISHGPMSDFARTIATGYDMGVGDRFLQFCSISFDMSVREIFPALSCGAAVVVLPPDQDLSSPSMIGFVAQFRVTMMILPTAYWHQWSLEMDRSGTRLPEGVRLVDVGGEQVNRGIFDRWRRTNGERVTLANTYGPTETTVVASWYFARPDDPGLTGEQAVPIGRVLPGRQLHVLDQDLLQVPIGVPGELYIGGSGVGRGYLGKPGLSATRFLPDPFSPVSGQRLYRSGDICRYLPDGNLEFMGRSDHQVKIRGFRVECGEIESLLIQHPQVENAIVAAVSGQNGQKYLVAWLVLVKGSELVNENLSAWLGQHLPDYMIPSNYLALEALPLLPGGKINHKALPKPAFTSRKAHVPPRNELEAELLGIFQNLLGQESCGVLDSFFDLGGQSLLALQLMSRISRRFGRQLPIAVVYHSPTVEKLARFLAEEPSQSPVVAIRQGTKAEPWFFIHPAGGQVHCYFDLAAALTDGRSVFGIQSPGLANPDFREARPGETAAAYVKAIRRIQIRGPYFLAGWSVGGVIAHEIGRQLEQDGEEIARLLLIDSLCPVLRQQPQEETLILRSFLAELALLIPTGLVLTDGIFSGLPCENPVLALQERLEKQNLLPPGMDGAYFQNLYRVFEAHYRGDRSFVPQAVSAKIDLIRAEQTVAGNKALLGPEGGSFGWDRFSLQPVCVHDLPGSHYSLFQKEQLPMLAQIVSRLSNHTIPRS